jgi:transcriptional regulator with XRE-family HTH domain
LSITPDQCRAARAIINWSQAKLSEAAGVSRATLAEFEAGKRNPILNNINSIQSTLESAGVIFVDENGQGPGVRLRKNDDEKSRV